MAYKNLRDCRHYLFDIEAIDYFLAKEISEFLDNDDSDIFHILIALSESYRQGHSCLDLAEVANQTLWSEAWQDVPKVGYNFGSLSELQQKIESLNFTSKEFPIAYKFGCLYFRRLWLYENEIAEVISSRLKLNIKSLDLLKAKKILEEIFDNFEVINYQKIAVANSLIRSFSIISGGPGTGKTTTIMKLLCALGYTSSNSKLIVRILAPTGKATNRLIESLDLDQFSSNTNIEIMTIHRFLGFRNNSTKLRYYKENQADCDALIIDEASMLDIGLFVKILRAIKPDCKLILIGDINQLPSVEAGNLLAEFTNVKSSSDSVNETKKVISQLTDYYDFTLINEFIVYLQKNYRSNKEISDFAKSIISKDIKNLYPKTDAYNSINFHLLSELDKVLSRFVHKYYFKLMVCENVKKSFEILKSFRILLANKSTHIGVDNLNKKIVNILGKQDTDYYNGKPIMVTENNYIFGVFNGDVGLVYDGEVYFEVSNTEFKKINIFLLPKHETAYAMTVHKTQGSEFNEVMMVLPQKVNKIISNKLIYTGVTRAKSAVTIVSDKEIWEYAITNDSSRFSNISKLIDKYLFKK
ncbi:exodeoxyribonuclease V subunit alpha [Allofrancisella guangzhouensis]|uniref:exodeoxyribonuclease V subunit alpha n=1 Tax=Allofrancisella guangzhouensis TaxID=594679 RepID=UPI000B2CB891|nr:exodeoxyribonuclease V subunit alpha [Allofrancisella guangzhouensis]MBK2026734.1 exodeoxyribonuclease V subunit alpha [Allofrancisella guangzhouensis]MBK2043659.1 exodeoxyribonuclease V subunit alpha [Allofrancisella guangzhouensis]MBK2046186.1 exodeoxyribonuclease V subunit alpha [Allofrancisella guangzhouensis]